MQRLVDEARATAETVRSRHPKPGEWASNGAHDSIRVADAIDRLADALEAAQRPPVSPEVREELATTKVPIIYPGGTRMVDLGYPVADALLARFSFPTLDVERVAQWIQNVRDAEYGIGAGREPSGTSRRDAAALIEALPSLTEPVGDGTSSDSEKEADRG